MLMIQQIRKRPFLLSLAIVIILFTLFFAFFTPIFFTSDDVGMMMIASGTGHGFMRPDEHVLFINVIIGFLLKRLYTALPYFPWYGTVSFLILFLSTVALLYSTLRRRFTFTRVLFFLLFFVTVELYFLVNTQFTFTAYLAGAAGVFLFLSAVEDEKYTLPLLFAMFLMILSSLIRIQAFYMALLLGAPLLTIKFARNLNKKVIGRYAVFFISLIVLSSGFQYYQTTYYEKDPLWKEFQPTMNATAAFTDYSRAGYHAETKHIFDEVGWSKNDFRMLLKLFRADEDVFSLKKMEKVLAGFPEHKSFGKEYLLFFIKREALAQNEYVIFFFILALFFLSYTRREKVYFLKIFSTLGWIFVLMGYIIFYKYLKDRVYFSMISFLTFTALFYSDKDVSFRWPKERIFEKLKVLSLLCFSILILFCMGATVYRLNVFSRHTHDVSLRFKRDIARLNPSPKELFVVWTSSFPYRLVLPFDNLRYISNLRLVGTELLPATAEKIAKFGVRNLSTDLCNRNDISLIVNNGMQRYIYKTYMKEHYGLNVFFKPDRRSGLSVFKVICY